MVSGCPGPAPALLFEVGEARDCPTACCCCAAICCCIIALVLGALATLLKNRANCPALSFVFPSFPIPSVGVVGNLNVGGGAKLLPLDDSLRLNSPRGERGAAIPRVRYFSVLLALLEARDDCGRDDAGPSDDARPGETEYEVDADGDSAPVEVCAP